MKLSLFLILTVSVLNVFAADYPAGPNAELTPGSLCAHPDSYRYPEQIAYCTRDVTPQEKDQIFANYRTRLGFKLDLRIRSNFKIDHFIPLCAGGSNEATNLWPQHISIFQITDPIESAGCEKLSAGKITQKELIKLIKEAKLNLTSVPRILRSLQSPL